MNKNRLEAFSDGVIAIIITIMVLEIKVPHGAEVAHLLPLLPIFLSYALSFIYVGIYWNNHHHMLYSAHHVDGRAMWANLHLLFWLSLIPFATGWMGENHFAAAPVALYGVALLMPAVAYYVLARALICANGRDSELAAAIGKDAKALLSILLYATAIGLSFVATWMAIGLYVLVALIWLVPDQRIEKRYHHGHHGE